MPSRLVSWRRIRRRQVSAVRRWHLCGVSKCLNIAVSIRTIFNKTRNQTTPPRLESDHTIVSVQCSKINQQQSCVSVLDYKAVFRKYDIEKRLLELKICAIWKMTFKISTWNCVFLTSKNLGMCFHIAPGHMGMAKLSTGQKLPPLTTVISMPEGGLSTDSDGTFNAQLLQLPSDR